jgi:hypothetical protein
MCTLTFLPNKDGYLLAMNRDELRERVAANPPSLRQIDSSVALYPWETSGGTWIAANARGDLFALMNANAPDAQALSPKRASRGEIIPALLGEHSLNDVERQLAEIPLSEMHPFRLLGFFHAAREIFHWSWDGARLNSRRHEWIRNHWFSSSRSDARAEAERGRVCEMSWREDAHDSVAWVRALHASHIPDAGAFSICVHRPDAATVSYTEVECRARELRMSYFAGNPCEFRGTLSAVGMPLKA